MGKGFWLIFQVGWILFLAAALPTGADGSAQQERAMSVEVSFRLAGGDHPLILLPVYVNGRGPYEFILDTGAGVSLLTPELARSLGLLLEGSAEGRGAGGAMRIDFTRIESLAVGPLHASDIKAGVTDDLHRIGAAIRAHVDGNLGYNYLKDFRFTLDYDRLRMTLTRPQNGTPPAASNAAVPFRIANPTKPLILVPVTINGRGPYQFILDTGASGCDVTSEVAASLGLHSTPAGSVTGAGGTIPVRRSRVDRFSVGNVAVQNLEVFVSDMYAPIAKIVGVQLDGIVGYSFLRQFLVTIDYPATTVRFDPRPATR